MADLRELHATIEALKQAGKSAKVSFYYQVEDDLKLHSGSIAVEGGSVCYISHRHLTPSEALDDIVRLKFSKVTSLPAIASDHAADPVPAVAIDAVLDRLDPAKNAVAAPEPVAEPPSAVEAPVAKQPHVFYSHVSLQQDVLALLESLYGSGAAKKVEEFARQAPPIQSPLEFASKCRQHAAMMLGAKKAEELFKPVFDKLSH